MRRLAIVALFICSTGAYAAGRDTMLTKSPTTAVLYSLACPGLGQYYTENYWKIPLFSGAAVTTLVLFFTNNASFNEAADAVNVATTNGDSFTIERFKRQREAFRANRDLAGAMFLVTYGLAAIDAYVGAHLFDFDVDDNLSMHIEPTSLQGVSLGMRYTW